MKTSRFSQLSASRQALVRLCQALNHGIIENLSVENSEPVCDPPPVTLKDVKLDSDEAPRPELALADFVLSAEVFRLMRRLDEMKLGTVRRVEVRGGVPRRVLVESPALCAPKVRKRQARSANEEGEVSAAQRAG
jgi:hypothetical protein